MSCIWGAWWHLPAAFLLAIGGIIGHELAHAIMMYPIAERVNVHIENIWLSELYVESEIRNTPWRHRWADLAGFAPLLFGTAIIGGLYYFQSLPDHTTVLGFGFYHAMIWFTFLGGASDYSRSRSVSAKTDSESGKVPPLVRSMSDGGQEFVEAEQRLLTTVLVGLLAAGVGMLYYDVCVGLVSKTGLALAGLAMLLSVASTGILLKRAREAGIEFDYGPQDY